MIEPGPGLLPRLEEWVAEVRVDPRRENRLIAGETRRFIATLGSSERFTPRLQLVRAGPRAAEKSPEYLAGVRVAVRDGHAARKSCGRRVHKDVRTLTWGSTRRYGRGGKGKARAWEVPLERERSGAKDTKLPACVQGTSPSRSALLNAPLRFKSPFGICRQGFREQREKARNVSSTPQRLRLISATRRIPTPDARMPQADPSRRDREPNVRTLGVGVEVEVGFEVAVAVAIGVEVAVGVAVAIDVEGLYRRP
jgi:hypothetical protein